MWPDQSQMRLSSVGVTLLVVCVAVGGAVMAVTDSRTALAAGALVGLGFLFSIRVADQWEKVAVLRFGRFIGLRGPGLFWMIPIVDRLSRYVDQRVSVSNVSAESTLTRDTVPVNVDAIVFWMVWNAEKAILEVQDFTQAITLSAQTALRESIGRHELHQMVAEREMLGRELQRILDEKTTAWGITVQSVRRFRTPCRVRRRRSANAARGPFWASRKPRSPKCSAKPRSPTRTTPWPCICVP